MSDLGQLYQSTILMHHAAPRHTGRLSSPTHAAEGHNPLCGDQVQVTLVVGDGRVLEVAQEVRGCAICRAAGSMMAEAIAGRSLAEVERTTARLLAALAAPSLQPEPPLSSTPSSAAPSGASASPGPTSVPDLQETERAAHEAEWGPLAPLLEARRFPGRRRCASLSWEALQRALETPRGA